MASIVARLFGQRDNSTVKSELILLQTNIKNPSQAVYTYYLTNPHILTVAIHYEQYKGTAQDGV